MITVRFRNGIRATLSSNYRWHSTDDPSFATDLNRNFATPVDPLPAYGVYAPTYEDRLVVSAIEEYGGSIIEDTRPDEEYDQDDIF